ncbi:hypothetical protein ORIO_14460 [Cereibacter azotoformans]|uniref:Uncharacterized protein n=1 Tax=Cereibacter sphaeroides (strain ATCC 17025 / ATH 2.4.3) TaxID=349102 RepID=A4WW73_CERS5|nr:hypothetical protein [Cereibacter azotoformans]ULB11099.1 hypothetical protein ORIO_14460 [Cereibacter azotoformans]
MTRIGMGSVLALLAASAVANAEPVVVRTGEHPGFTRLVVEDAGIRAWTLGRTAEGYALRLSPGGRTFALSNAFRIITRQRLGSLEPAPNGDLRIGLSCACHITPTEIRPGVIVLDIHDGAALAGATHEKPLPQPGVAEIRPRARPVSSPPPYDWRTVDRRPFEAAPAPPLEQPFVAAMRQSLVEQLSRGSAAGAVDFVEKPPVAESAAPATDPGANVRILPEPGYGISALQHDPAKLTATGAECPADERMDVASWLDDRPVAEQMSAALSGLTGEFDQPRPEAIAAAVRFYLGLGFGAEARLLLETFTFESADRETWETMARVLDGERQPGGPLSSMASCDTAAALWSVLADPPTSSRAVNAPAVLRAFSSLPRHLRQTLGPRLAETLMNLGDLANAEGIRQIMMRGSTDPSAGVTLTEARLMMVTGEPLPLADLERVKAEPGSMSGEALALLIERKAAYGEAPTADDVLQLAAMHHEARGTKLDGRLGRAYRLALALSGDFDQAFARHDLAPEADEDVWRLLAAFGPDSSLLEHAVLADSDPRPPLPQATRQALADRLRSLGLEASADRWWRGDDATKDSAAIMPPLHFITQGTDEVIPPVPAAGASGADRPEDEVRATADDAPQAASASQAVVTPEKAAVSLHDGRNALEESVRTRQKIEDLLRPLR